MIHCLTVASFLFCFHNIYGDILVLASKTTSRLGLLEVKKLGLLFAKRWFALENVTEVTLLLFISTGLTGQWNDQISLILLSKDTSLWVERVQVHNGNAVSTVGRVGFGQTAREIGFLVADEVALCVNVVSGDPSELVVAAAALPFLRDRKGDSILVLRDNLDCVLGRSSNALVNLDWVRVFDKRLTVAIVLVVVAAWFGAQLTTVVAGTWDLELPEATLHRVEFSGFDAVRTEGFRNIDIMMEIVSSS
jgi:hypothetical protein